KELPQDLFALLVDGSQRFKDHGAERPVGAFETRIVLVMLLGDPVLLRRTLVFVMGLVTATSIASELPLQSGIDTSPGRRPEVGPRIPFFSLCGFKTPSQAMA